jgi:hypothetical protein
LYLITHNWIFKAILLSIIAALIHSSGIFLFDLFLPNLDLSKYNIPLTLNELIWVLSIIVVLLLVGLNLFLARIMKNIVGSTLLLALFAAELFLTAVPRVF